MNLHLALSATATLVALGFALATYERWLDRRKYHEAAWTIALACFAAASAALWGGVAFGWSGFWFRAFYLLGAIVNVPYLALGTVALLGGAPLARRVGAGVHAFAFFSAGVVVIAPLTAGAFPQDGLPQGSDVFGALPRVLAAVGSGVAALVILGGAVWSIWRRPSRRMVVANTLIAVGTLVLSTGGLFNSVLDEMDAFAVSLVLGVTLLFAGFVVGTEQPRLRLVGVLSEAPAGAPSPPDPVAAHR